MVLYRFYLKIYRYDEIKNALSGSNDLVVDSERYKKEFDSMLWLEKKGNSLDSS